MKKKMQILALELDVQMLTFVESNILDLDDIYIEELGAIAEMGQLIGKKAMILTLDPTIVFDNSDIWGKLEQLF